MKRYRYDPFGALRPKEWAPKDNVCQTYQGFESRASLLNVGLAGAWLRLPTLAEELEAERRHTARIQADPFCDIRTPRYRQLADCYYLAPLVTWK